MSDYSPKEEKLNVVTHAIGIFLSCVALFLLVNKAIKFDNSSQIVSVTIYGVSLIIMYIASTSYHNAKEVISRKRLKIFDHAAIYVLIAGTYTPFTLITLEDTVGWTVFIVIWSMAIAGIILKLFFTGKFNTLSTVVYILMAWVIIFAIKPLVNSLSYDGLFWLFAGGAAYMIGALLYSIKKIKYNHAIFHVFVLLGSYFHFYAVYKYVLGA